MMSINFFYVLFFLYTANHPCLYILTSSSLRHVVLPHFYWPFLNFYKSLVNTVALKRCGVFSIPARHLCFLRDKSDLIVPGTVKLNFLINISVNNLFLGFALMFGVLLLFLWVITTKVLLFIHQTSFFFVYKYTKPYFIIIYC